MSRADRLDQAAIFVDHAAEMALKAKRLLQGTDDEDEAIELYHVAMRLHGVAYVLEDKWDSVA